LLGGFGPEQAKRAAGDEVALKVEGDCNVDIRAVAGWVESHGVVLAGRI
jgi:hypothetical protein